MEGTIVFPFPFSCVIEPSCLLRSTQQVGQLMDPSIQKYRALSISVSVGIIATRGRVELWWEQVM